MSAAHETYRIYSFDLARKLVTADVIKAANDEEAIAMIESGNFGHKCEIWNERRLVAQIGAERRRV